MFNSRGQNLEYVKKSVEDNMKFESIFKNHIKDKYDIILDKNKNQFKNYDFSFNKKVKIEYKGLYYTLNDANNSAISIKDNKKKINDVFISKTKIAYYKIRQLKNPFLKFFLIYGFYEIKNDVIDVIKYRYIDISDLDKIILNFQTYLFENAKHYKIPIKLLEPLPDENPFIIRPI